jgi:hypothetical protein
MLYFFWHLILMFVSLAAELIGARFGILFPGSFVLCFYLTVSRGWRSALGWGAAACLLSEIALGRESTALPCLLPLLAFSLAWRHFGDRRYVITQALPGLLLGISYAGYVLLVENLAWPVGVVVNGRRALVLLGGAAAAALIGTPILLFHYDLGARLIGVERFHQQRRPS